MNSSTTNLSACTKDNTISLKDPGSAITHFIALILSVAAAPFLLIKSFHMSGFIHGLSMCLFIAGLMLLYSASTIYHSLDISPVINDRLKKFDHMMIYVLIAGSYSPICLIALGDKRGIILLIVIWALALLGCLQALLFVHCPKWISSIIYIAMGWMCIFAFSQIYQALYGAAFAWLLAGGIIYTMGGVIYALKLPIFNTKHKNFGSHEIFHLFCMGGSMCHYILMYVYLASMPV